MRRERAVPEDEPEQLLLALDEARSRITALIAEGQGLVQKDIRYSTDGVAAFLREKMIWVDFVTAALGQLFRPSSLAERFLDAAQVNVFTRRESVEDTHRNAQDAIERGIGELQSLARRAELMTVVAEPGGQSASRASPHASTRVFVVHGHDEVATKSVEDLLRRLDLDAVVLRQEPDRGQTLLDKFERHADVGFAVILLTADDEGRVRGEGPLGPRARQNVILEHGYFLARLGREHVTALRAPGVEVPSDLGGVLYKELDPAGAWRLALAKELRAAGFPVDLNRL